MSSPKPPPTKGLGRWFAEEWVDEDGNPCGSDKKELKKCRPKKRITKDTPVTWSEMTPAQKRKAVAVKKKVGMGRKAPAIKKKKAMSAPVKTVRKPVRRGKKYKGFTTPGINMSSSNPVPANPTLYAKVKREAKAKFKIWPSAYGSGWLVKEYKRRGGTYK